MSTINLTRALAIDGYMSPAELRWLAQRAQRARTIVEIGSYQGRSTRALADHCSGRIYAIDPWSAVYLRDDETPAKWITKHYDWPALRALFERHLRDHLATGRVVMMPYRSVEAREQLREAKVDRADLVFIDGDHRYEMVTQDIALYRDLIPPGGLLAGHDYGHADWPGVKRAVDAIFPQASHWHSIWWMTA